MDVKNTAWLEPISAVIRVGEFGAKHLDGYHFAATVRYRSIDEIEIVGVAKQGNGPGITKADWSAMVDCLRESGVKRVLFSRIKNGVVRNKLLTINKVEDTGLEPMTF